MRELSLHILDLVQNAVEADATEVKLEIVESFSADTLTIRVRDNGRGMEEKERDKVVDPFHTSRTTRRIGLGLPLIQMSTQRCDGHLKIESQRGKGTLVEAVYRHSHWDRPPLGNMADTLQTILVGNPTLDFHYLHRVAERSFRIAASEIKEILGGVPLTQPEILQWLQEYLKENLAILYGGVENEES